MKTIIVTGAGGLIGRETVEFFSKKGFQVIGIDNNLRKHFFGEDGSVESNIISLKENTNYHHIDLDIREQGALRDVFDEYGKDIFCIIHTAAQPSHDWAVKEPLTDFGVNATGTLNLLELTRKYCSSAVFIHMSTNKVYGDNPNRIPLKEYDTRWEADTTQYMRGFREDFSVDQCTHSLFGCSKLASDMYVQEYGKYFGMRTAVFRGGCLTGSRHKGAELHGFLNYLVKCAKEGREYKIYGYKGKQVRDNIHSYDLIAAFWEVVQAPRVGEVYNIGGSRHSNCSVLEAIDLVEKVTGKKMVTTYVDQNRVGDHIWWISDVSKFQSHYPKWKYTYTLENIIEEIVKNI